MSRQQTESEAAKHKLWSPVPRKIRRTDNNQTNLVTSLLCNLLEAATKGNTSSFSESSQVQSNPIRSFAQSLLKNTNGSFDSKDSQKMKTESECSLSSLTTNESKSAPISQNSLNALLPIQTLSNEIQTSNQNDLQSFSERFIKKANSTPAPSNADCFSHSQKVFLNSFFSQNFPQKSPFSISNKNESFSQSSAFSLSNLLQTISNKESSSSSQFPKKSASTTEPKTKCKKCNCKNSKCLKLYCECLASGEYCGPDCGCQSCNNNAECETTRNFAISQIVEKNPYAFHNPTAASVSNKRDSTLNPKLFRHKGCTCKKSGCNKKYCECFAAGISCGDHCRCENCKNCSRSKPHDSAGLSDCSFNCGTEEDSMAISLAEESSLSTVNPHISRGLGLHARENNMNFLNTDLAFLKRDSFQNNSFKRSLSEKDTTSVKTVRCKILQGNTNNGVKTELPSLFGNLGKMEGFNKENFLKN